MSLIDTLRKAVQDSGLSDNALAKLVKVSQPTISRFRTGNDIKFSVAAKLAEHFGLELVKAKPARTGMTDGEARKAIREGAAATKRVNDAIRDRKRGG